MKALILICKTYLIWVDAISPPTLANGFENCIYLAFQKYNDNALGSL